MTLNPTPNTARKVPSVNARPATLGAGMEQKPQVKVWQPQGFEGLELEAFNPGPSHALARLVPSFSIQVAYSGQALIHYQRRKHSVRFERPALITQSPGEVFGFALLDSIPLVVKNFEVSHDLFVRLTRELGQKKPLHFPHLLLESAPHTYLTSLFSKTFASFEQPASQLERESRFLNLISVIIHHCADDSPPERHLGKEHRAVGLIKDYLCEHLADDVTLANLSALTDLNKDHLIRVFARDVGITPHVYQTNLRIHEAKKLLAAGTSIAETALLTGFSDQSHLHHKFKKYVMVTPGEYRRTCAPQKVLASG